MSDNLKALAERLRKEAEYQSGIQKKNELLITAAALIEAQQEEIARMRVALNEIASWDQGESVTGSFDEPHSARAARAALEAQS